MEELSVMAKFFDSVQFKNKNVNNSRIWTEEESPNTQTSHSFEPQPLERTQRVCPWFALCSALGASQTWGFDFSQLGVGLQSFFKCTPRISCDITSPSSHNHTDLPLGWNACFSEEMPSNGADFKVRSETSATGQTASMLTGAPTQQTKLAKAKTFSHLLKPPKPFVFCLLCACRLTLKMQLRLCTWTASKHLRVKSISDGKLRKALERWKSGTHSGKLVHQEAEI